MARAAERARCGCGGNQALGLVAAAALVAGAVILVWPQGSVSVRGGWRAGRPVRTLESGRRRVARACDPLGELPVVIDFTTGDALDLRDAEGRVLGLGGGAWLSLHGARVELLHGTAWLRGPRAADWLILFPRAPALRLAGEGMGEGSAALRVEAAGLRIEVGGGRLWIGARSVGAGRAVIVDFHGRVHHVPPTRGSFGAGPRAQRPPSGGAAPGEEERPPAREPAWTASFGALIGAARRGEPGALTRGGAWARTAERSMIAELLARARAGCGPRRSRLVAAAIELGGAEGMIAAIDALSVAEILEIRPHLRRLACGESLAVAATAAGALALAGDLEALAAVSSGLERASRLPTVERLAVAAARLGSLRPVAALRAALHRRAGEPGSAALFAALGAHATEADFEAVSASEQEALARCALRARRPLGAGFLEVWPRWERGLAGADGALDAARSSNRGAAAFELIESILGDPLARVAPERLQHWTAFGVTLYELERFLAGERQLPQAVLEDLPAAASEPGSVRSPGPPEESVAIALWRRSRARRHVLEDLVLERLDGGGADLRDEAWKVAPFCGGYRLWWWLDARIEGAAKGEELKRVVDTLEVLGGAAPCAEEIARCGLRGAWQRFLRTLGSTWRPPGEGLLP